MPLKLGVDVGFPETTSSSLSPTHTLLLNSLVSFFSRWANPSSFLLALFVCLDLLFSQRISWVQMKRLKHTHTHTHIASYKLEPHISAVAKHKSKREETHPPTHPSKSFPLTTLILCTALSLCSTQQQTPQHQLVHFFTFYWFLSPPLLHYDNLKVFLIFKLFVHLGAKSNHALISRTPFILLFLLTFFPLFSLMSRCSIVSDSYSVIHNIN